MEFKRCSGYEGHWECADDYPDHRVPVGEFGPDGDGLQGKCRRCKTYYNGKYNPTMPRHPETGQRKMHWLTARAKKYYGGMPKDRNADKYWKEYMATATSDADSINWVKPPKESNVLTIPISQNFSNSHEEVTTVTKGRKRDQKVGAYIRSIYDSCSVVGCDYPDYEVAHIHALKHGADDLPENCLALCPNHHRDLDRGRMIDLRQLDVGGYIYFGEQGIKLKHKVDSKYLDQCNLELEEWKNANAQRTG